MDCLATQDKTIQKHLSKLKVRTWGVRLWTRLSPAHLLRVFADNYVKGCVAFANGSEADTHASSFTVTLWDDKGAFTSASHPGLARGIASVKELNPDLSSKLSHHESVQGAPPPENGSVHLAHKHHFNITGCHGVTMADLQGQSSPLHKVGASGLAMVDSGAFQVSSLNGFDAVPESKQQTDSANFSEAGGLEALLQTSALHPTEFLQSASRRGAAFWAHRVGHLIPRDGGGRMLRRPRSRWATSTSVSIIALSSRPLTPVTDMSIFRVQSRRRSRVGGA